VAFLFSWVLLYCRALVVVRSIRWCFAVVVVLRWCGWGLHLLMPHLAPTAHVLWWLLLCVVCEACECAPAL
jgi:hypothetical protein